MRPTTKDLAHAAGVSLATIDRVLNGRPGVREETVEAVNQAIDALGFVRNLSAANLARGADLPLRLPAAAPRRPVPRGAGRADRGGARGRRGRFDPRAPPAGSLHEEPHQAARVIAEQTPDSVDGVAIMAPESPQVRDAIDRLVERGVRGGAVRLRPVPGTRVDSSGIDNCAAGATAARLLGRFAGAASRRDPRRRGDDERARQPRTPARLRPRADAGLPRPQRAALRSRRTATRNARAASSATPSSATRTSSRPTS